MVEQLELICLRKLIYNQKISQSSLSESFINKILRITSPNVLLSNKICFLQTLKRATATENYFDFYTIYYW